MATVTKPIALDESLNTTELSSRNVADVLAQELSAVATAIGGISAPSAEDVSYDNSGSGLSATDVQNALDEIVSDIPTVNNGTLTIQQNGTSIGSFSANTASNVTANIKTPTADKKTATTEFNTADGGLLSKCQINLVPVQSGSGDPSPDNVRPISGHTEVDLYNVGKNLLSGVEDGGVTDYGTTESSTIRCRSIDYIPVKPNTQYTFKALASGGALQYIIRTFYDNNNTYKESDNGGWHSGAYSFTTSNDVHFVKIIFSYTSHTAISASNIYDAQLEKGSTATDFEPYLGHLYTVQIGSTVYGGYVDLVSGVMTVDRISYTWDGSENWAIAPSDQNAWFYLNKGDLKSGMANDVICNMFRSSGSSVENSVWRAFQQIHVRADSNIAPSGVTSAGLAEFKTYLSTHNLQVVYPLANPQTIQLTPQQIEALVGENNLSTPLSGQSIETNGVEYKELFTFADVKEYVDKKIPDAPTTDGTYTLQAVVSDGVPTYSWV